MHTKLFIFKIVRIISVFINIFIFNYNNTQTIEMKTFLNYITDIEELQQNLICIKEDKTNKTKYFFNTILFFTNERDSSKNKTLKKLEEAVEDTNINIIPLVAEEVHYVVKDDKILINDDKTSIVINEQSNVDTICIVRLGAQDSEECCECIKEIQDWGIFTLNPIQSAKKASNKYTTAVLLNRYDIPQPKYTLVCKNDIEKGLESLSKKLKDIHKEAADYESDDAQKCEYVVKILNGHGGTGVFLVNGKTILATLQAMFAINEDIELLVQAKEEADGGDIRVHVLTMRTEQKILAAMKRKKLGKDFRSNVSLGATAEPIELTEKQKEIALKVAKISGMPWCAVDIMPLVKGSNDDFKEYDYNVVLGISEVIGENFMKILLTNINNINELVLAPKTIGYVENITLTMEDATEIVMECKLDTGNGAKASTIGCDKVTEYDDHVNASIDGHVYMFEKVGVSKAIVGQVTEERITVKIPCIQIGTRKLLNAEFALVDNRDKKQKVLINREIMSKLAYNISPMKKHLLVDEFADLKVVDKKYKKWRILRFSIFFCLNYKEFSRIIYIYSFSNIICARNNFSNIYSWTTNHI